MTDAPPAASSRADRSHRPKRRHAAGVSRIAVAGVSVTAMFTMVAALGAREAVPQQVLASAAIDSAAAAQPAPALRIEVRLRRVPVTGPKPVRKPVAKATVAKAAVAKDQVARTATNTKASRAGRPGAKVAAGAAPPVVRKTSAGPAKRVVPKPAPVQKAAPVVAPVVAPKPATVAQPAAPQAPARKPVTNTNASR